jgi:hypothetical protein
MPGGHTTGAEPPAPLELAPLPLAWLELLLAPPAPTVAPAPLPLVALGSPEDVDPGGELAASSPHASTNAQSEPSAIQTTPLRIRARCPR